MAETFPTSHLQEAVRTELVTRELARRSFPVFCEYVFGWPAYYIDGTPVVPLHHEWDQFITECHAAGVYCGIMAPRDHGKTQQIARARVLWELGRSTIPRLAWCPNIRIKLFQNTDEKATETVEQMKTDIESNEKLRAVFPAMVRDKSRRWTQHKIFIERTENLRDASIEAAGILTSATSGRGDLIIGDDMCDLKNSVLQPVTREKVVLSWDAVVTNLMEPNARVIDIGTAWHEEDLNGQLQKRKHWKWKVYRIQETPGAPMVPLWPGKWGIEELMRRYENSAREFDRGFNHWAYGAGESLVDWNDVKACFDYDTFIGDVPPRAGGCRLKLAGYDLAISKQDEAAYFAGFVWGQSGSGIKFPLDIVHGRYAFRQQVAIIVDLHQKWSLALSIIENNAYQDAMVQQLAHETKIPLEAFTTGKQKMDPYIGLPSFAPAFQNRTIIIPVKGHDGRMHTGEDPTCQCPQCKWLRELKSFPGANTDLVMAAWFGFNRLTAWSGQIVAAVSVEATESATSLIED